MREKLVIVPKKKTTGKKVLNMAWFLLTCLMLLLSTFVAPTLFFVPAVVFGVIWYFQAFRSDIEYEYTYYDGDLRLARIKAKRKRKAIAKIQMDDVMIIAPKGDRSVFKYEGDNSITCKNLTSGEEGCRIYEMICKGEKQIIRYEFEPDEDMLDAIMVKYPRSVVK